MEVDDSQGSNGYDSTARSAGDLTLPPKHSFKILIASDIHLGVHEKDPERGDDSFKAFEEILKTARERDVDFILLGGDLFDQSKPSQSCYVKAITLIREHIMGDKEISMALHDVVHAKEVFETSVIDDVNYQDPNVNISYPIFSIHGNHDDPSGFQRTSAMHVLSATGQVYLLKIILYTH